MTPWLALIESNTSGTGRLFARAAIQQGYRPILLSADPSRYEYARADGLDVLQVDTSDKSVLIDACRRLATDPMLAGVTSSSEYFIATAAALASRLGLPGPRPEAVRSCRNKWKQRLHLKAAGVGMPQFRLATSMKTAIKAAEEVGFPVIIKPVSGSGSAGVRLCENREAASTHAAALLRQRRNERGQPVLRQILIEQMAVGPEYSVETFNHQIIGVTRKHLGALPHFVEVGHDYPAVVSKDDLQAICQIVDRSLKALNLGWGPAHFELRVTLDGPRIIEVNPRLAGGFIPELVRLAFGIDLLSSTIAQATGTTPQLEKQHNRHASLRFLLPTTDGALAGVEGIDEAGRIDGIIEARLYCKLGDQVRRRGDFRDRIGHVIAVAETPTAACAAAESAHSQIRLIVNPE